MVEVIAAAAAGAQALFNYNRKNYMWDQELRIKREYQGQVRLRVKREYQGQVRSTVNDDRWQMWWYQN